MSIDVSPPIQEKTAHFDISFVRGYHQCRQTMKVVGRHTTAFIDQGLGGFDIAGPD